MIRVVAIAVTFAAALLAAEVQAANQIVRMGHTTTGGYPSNTWTLTADAKTTASISYADSVSVIQGKADTTFGVGNVTVTKSSYMTGSDGNTIVYFEFGGIYATYIVSWSTSGTGFSYVSQAASGGAYVPPDPPEPEGTPASEETLLLLVAGLEELRAAMVLQTAAHDREVFLLQSLAQTMGLICGGLIWRTIILSKNQSRIW